MSTGIGTAQDPIIAMSADPRQIVQDVRASLAAAGRTDDGYWIGLASSPAEFSNHLWHLGWNAYWEARAQPGNTGSADPNLGRSPAVNRADVVTTVPDPIHAAPGTPSTTPPEPAPQSDVLAALTLARLNQMDATLTALLSSCRSMDTSLAVLRQQGYSGTIFGYRIALNPAPKP